MAAFHLDCQHLREVGAGLGDGVRFAHELITGADEADLGLVLALLGDAGLGQGDEPVIAGEGGGLLGHLTHLVTEGGHVHVVETHLAGDDHVPDVQVLGEAAGGAGVDDAIGANFSSSRLVATLAATLPMPERVRITSLPARRP